MLVWECVQVNLGQKCRKLASIIQGINAQLRTRIKWPTRQPHMWRNTATSKATRHQSVATPSRRIRCIHEDQRAHQSFQTALRQAMPHIYEMGAHLAMSQSSLEPNGDLYRSADQQGQPTIGRFVSAPSSMCWLPIRCQGWFQEAQGWIHGRRGHGTPL